MPSARSRVLNAFTRIATRVAYRSPKPVVEYRPRYASVDARNRKPLPRDLELEEIETPIPGRWLRSARASRGPTLLYLHGGAFVLRLPRTHTALAASFCDALGGSAFLPWYRLAPEHPFPAAPEDCLRAYRYLLETGEPPERVVLMGDSAGANLVLGLLHQLKRERLPMPRCAVAFSPITDFAQVSATWLLNTWRDPMYVVQGAVSPQRHYLQGASVVDPIASPYYGDLAGLPPLLLVVGGLEALLDDSVSFAKKAVEAGVPAQVQIWKGMPHVFLLYEMIPETALARREVATWIRERMLGSPRGGPLHQGCVELVDRRAFTGHLTRSANHA